MFSVSVASVAVPDAYASSGIGIERYSLTATEADESPDTQAGSHPYELTSEVAFDRATGMPRDVRLQLPSGMTLDPGAVALCVIAELARDACPDDSAVGVVTVHTEGSSHLAAVYALEAGPGTLGRLGFEIEGVPFFAETSLRSGGQGMTLSIDDITQTIAVTAVQLTLWGVPADAGHDAQRGGCLASHETTCQGASTAPFLTLPTSCAAGSDTTTALADSWSDPGEWASVAASPAPLAGCSKLAFEPTLSVAPDGGEVDEPTGYTLRVDLPQHDSPEGLATAQLRDASVTLPAGVSLSLSATNGLTGCTEAQFAPQPGEPEMCPNSSRVGQVEIDTPLLPKPLQGAVFLATPNANPQAALVGLYIAAEEPVSGAQIELAGQLVLDPNTGQPTLTLDDLPQLPIGEVELHLFGGERSLLANPPTCGPATSTADLLPWSAGGETVEAPTVVSSSFDVTHGVDGGPCLSPAPFEPELRVQPTTVPAGATSQLELSIVRQRGEQALSGFSVQLPTGVAWAPSGVPPCGEPLAGQGACPPASQIGRAILQVGPVPGLASFTGAVYLTEDAAGQYGLSIAFDAVAGPFDLGEAIVAATIVPSPSTGALTIASDPLPQIADGIPLQATALELDIERFGLILDPTVCESRQIGAMIAGGEGALAQTSNPFTVEGCTPPAGSSGPAETEGQAGPGGGTLAPASAHTTRHDIAHVRGRVSGDHLLLTFTTALAGTVTISGRDVHTYTKQLRPGVHRVRLGLSTHGLLAARRHRRVELRLALRSAGRTGGGSVSTNVAVGA